MTTGNRIRPIDWDARTRGTERYAHDLVTQEHLFVRILRSPYPYASIRAIDVSAAERVPGVHAVITQADFLPGKTYLHRGEPWSDRPPLAAGVVRFVGQEIAAVAAETVEQADSAIRAIKVRYKKLTAPLTIEEAVKPHAPKLHNRSGGSNIADRWTGEWGRTDAGITESNIHTSGKYIYPSVAHACMEPNTTVAIWHEADQQLELWTSTQAPFFVVKEVAHVLDLEPEQVVCREIAVGGGFGSKSKISEHEALAGALARKARRPVVLALSREEEFASNKPRHRFETTIKTYADKSGLLRAIEADIAVDNGAYNHMGPSVMRAGVLLLPSTYRPDGVRFDSVLVDTANQPGGQFRGYGQPQVAFALESEIDELAKRLETDPIDFRLRNAVEAGAVTLSGARYTTARLADCLLAARDAIDWDRKRNAREPGRGLGVAVGMHGSGAYSFPDSNRSDAALDIYADGRIRVRFGGADAGTGQRTVLAQIVSSELRIDVDRIEVLSIDSELTPFDMGAWSSRGTHMSGNAVRQVAVTAANRLLDLARVELKSNSVTLEGGMATSSDGEIAYADLVRFAPESVAGLLTFTESFVDKSVEMFDGQSDKANLFPTYSFSAHVAEVEVDEQTGRIKILDYVAATDCGAALNPTLVEGQIIGGVAMGMGAALGEEVIRENGKVVNPAYINYALPRANDTPRIRTIVLDGYDDAGPHGAKSVGELPVIPVAPAIANAVADAIGVRIRELPLTPDKILNALAERDGRRRNLRLWRRPKRWWIGLLRWLYPRGLHHVLHHYGTRINFSPKPGEITDLSHPTSFVDAVEQVKDGAVFVGGGTDLLLQNRQGLIDGSKRLVSTVNLIGMRRIERLPDGGFLIGGAATLAEMADRLGGSLPALKFAIESIASAQIRNAATVAGNLLQAKRCWFFRNDFPCYKRNGVTSPCYAINGDHRFYHAAIDGHRCQAVTPSDLATALVALDAQINIDDGSRSSTVPMGRFYRGPGESVLSDAELLTSVQISGKAASKAFAFKKLALWEGDFAAVSVALSATVSVNGVWSDVRMVLGAIAPTPWRARATEAALEGQRLSIDGIKQLLNKELDDHAHPLSNNGWKLDAVVGLVAHAAAQIQLTATEMEKPT